MALTNTLVASGAKTTSSSSTVLEIGDVVNKMRVQLECTARSGTNPTLDVVIEDTVDGTSYNTIGTFTQLTNTGRQVIDITGVFTNRVRARWTIGGTATPTFTFSVVAYAE